MTLLKSIHVLTAGFSIVGFAIRGIWMITDSPLLKRRLVRIVPHIVDTILLISAVVLAVNLRLNPLTETWLTAKIVALLVYIGLGFVALRLGKTRHQRVIAWCLAITVFGYIVGVAVTRNPSLVF